MKSYFTWSLVGQIRKKKKKSIALFNCKLFASVRSINSLVSFSSCFGACGFFWRPFRSFCSLARMIVKLIFEERSVDVLQARIRLVKGRRMSSVVKEVSDTKFSETVSALNMGSAFSHTEDTTEERVNITQQEISKPFEDVDQGINQELSDKPASDSDNEKNNTVCIQTTCNDSCKNTSELNISSKQKIVVSNINSKEGSTMEKKENNSSIHSGSIRHLAHNEEDVSDKSGSASDNEKNKTVCIQTTCNDSCKNTSELNISSKQEIVVSNINGKEGSTMEKKENNSSIHSGSIRHLAHNEENVSDESGSDSDNEKNKTVCIQMTCDDSCKNPSELNISSKQEIVVSNVNSKEGSTMEKKENNSSIHSGSIRHLAHNEVNISDKAGSDSGSENNSDNDNEKNKKADIQTTCYNSCVGQCEKDLSPISPLSIQIDEEMKNNNHNANLHFPKMKVCNVNLSNGDFRKLHKRSLTFNKGAFPYVLLKDSRKTSAKKQLKNKGNIIVNPNDKSSKPSNRKQKQIKKIMHENTEQKNLPSFRGDGHIAMEQPIATDIKLKSAKVFLSKIDDYTLMKYGISSLHHNANELDNRKPDKTDTLSHNLSTVLNKVAINQSDKLTTDLSQYTGEMDGWNSGDCMENETDVNTSALLTTKFPERIGKEHSLNNWKKSGNILGKESSNKTKVCVNLCISDTEIATPTRVLSKHRKKTGRQEIIVDNSLKKTSTLLEADVNSNDIFSTKVPALSGKENSVNTEKKSENMPTRISSTDFPADFSIPKTFLSTGTRKNIGREEFIPHNSIHLGDSMIDYVKGVKTAKRRRMSNTEPQKSLENQMPKQDSDINLKMARVEISKIDDTILSKYGYDTQGSKIMHKSTKLNDNTRNSSAAVKTFSNDTCKENMSNILNNSPLNTVRVVLSRIDTPCSTPQHMIKTDLSPINKTKKREFGISSKSRNCVKSNFITNFKSMKYPYVTVTRIDDMIPFHCGISCLKTNMKSKTEYQMTTKGVNRIRKTTNNLSKQSPLFSDKKQSRIETIRCTVDIHRIDAGTHRGPENKVSEKLQKI